MMDKSSNAEAAHLWKALSEDEIKVNSKLQLVPCPPLPNQSLFSERD
jgi:hypothetical protein